VHTLIISGDCVPRFHFVVKGHVLALLLCISAISFASAPGSGGVNKSRGEAEATQLSVEPFSHLLGCDACETVRW
jgi:hypothetical protein